MPWQGGAMPVLRAMRAHPGPWLKCASIGFVGFYLLLAYAAASGPAWLVAGSFQFTVVAGMLCAPLLYRDMRAKVPPVAYAIGAMILVGVALLQFGFARGTLKHEGWVALVCVLVSATLYPLGNRMLLLHLERTGEPLNATQRVFGMTLASQPLWLLVAAFAWHQVGPPPMSQTVLAAGVSISAGIVATILFFQATGMVRDNPAALGAAEAMQAAELLIAMVLGVMFLGEAWPNGISFVGSAIVIAGICGFAWIASRPSPVTFVPDEPHA
jgi:drug/metabolite transporter (DMT)-like permease